jgi:Flp pilus assembly pilin Flp
VAAEYALIVALIGAGVTLATTNLGAAISSAFDAAQGYF